MIKLLKSPWSKAVQRSCSWLSALISEVGSVISSAPKSSWGAVMLTVPLLVVPVAVIKLFELKKKSEIQLMFPPCPAAAFALIRLLFRTINCGSIVMLPPVPP